MITTSGAQPRTSSWFHTSLLYITFILKMHHVLTSTVISQPLLIWDGTCGFCKYWTTRWKKLSGDKVTYVPYQEVANRFANISVDQFRKAVHLIEPDGSIYLGAAAALRTIAYGSPRRQFLYRWYESYPWLKSILDRAYVWVADHRSLLYRISILLWGRDPNRLKMYWLLYLIGILGLTYMVLSIL